MLEKQFIIQNKLGLHARAATKLVKHAARYTSDITIIAKAKSTNCKSIMGVMLLAANKGTPIILNIEGKDEIEAMADLENLINNKFDED